MKGLELSEKYFNTHGLPLIQNKFSQYEDRIAAGLVGEGSECLGFDDEFSMDHDWGPCFRVWLIREDYETMGARLNEEIAGLPKTFAGYGPKQTSEWGQGRDGVFELNSFYKKFTGLDHTPAAPEEWLRIPEDFLATATNGKVFYDPLGEFTKQRNKLLEFYPDDVRLKKIAARCMGAAQSGQYNFPRCIKRKEYLAAQYAETKFCADVISLIFLLNRSYTPFYKWMHRAVRDLPVLGQGVYSEINNLITAGYYRKKGYLIEKICALIIDEFKRMGLSDSKSDFLLDHGPVVHSKIKDFQLRKQNVWVG